MIIDFLKEYWYPIISSILIMTMIILFIISTKQYTRLSTLTNPNITKISYLNKNSSPFITNLYISSSNTKDAINCAPGFSKMLVADQTQSWNSSNSSGTLNIESKAPYVYICYKTNTNVTEDTPVLTDIKFNNIGSENGIVSNTYKCCDINRKEICYGNYMDCIGRCCPSGQSCNNGICQ
jgi:hypothetical protein